MSVRLNGSTSGYTELDAPAVAGNNILRMPTDNGVSGQSMVTDGSGNLSFGSSIARGTAKTYNWNGLTNNTSIEFTGIPTWARRLTVMLNGVSTNGTSAIQVQLGTGAGPTFVTSGYLGASMAVTTSLGAAGEQNGNGFRVCTGVTAASIIHGSIIISNLTGNTWSLSSVLGQSDLIRVSWAGGSTALAAALTALRVTTVLGADFFDAGSINLLWE
jgi:hypothetical protein